jgi:hypothetical protein
MLLVAGAELASFLAQTLKQDCLAKKRETLDDIKANTVKG